MTPSLIALLLALAPLPGAGTGGTEPPPLPHDLHLTSANAAVEGEFVLLRVRFFKDDLEAALGRQVGTTVLALTESDEADRIFLAYLAEHLAIRVDGERLAPAILAKGEDVLDREPVWWYALEYRAAAPVTRLTMRNTLLFELFDDQRNVVKFVHFPEESQQTFAFAPGEAEHEAVFRR